MAEKQDFSKQALAGRNGPPGIQMERAKLKDTKKTLGRLWSYLSAKKVPIVVAMLFVLANSVLTIAASYMVRPIINGITEGYGWSYLAQQLLIMGILYGVAALSYYIQSRIMLEIAQSSLAKLRLDLFDKLEKLPLRYFDSNNNGDLMSRFTNDVDAISQMLSNTCVQVVSGVVTLVATLGVMLYTNWILTIVTVVTVPLFTYLSKLLSSKSMKYFVAQQRSIGDLNGYIEESITGQKVIKVFNHEGEAVTDFRGLNESYRTKSMKAQFLAGSMGPVMGALSLLTYSITAVVGGLLCIFAGFDIGGYTIFVNYAKSFSRPVSDIFMQINTVFSALAGAERVFEVMDEVPEVEDAPEATVLQNMVGEIVFQNVHFGYRPDKLVLKDISLVAKPSQKIAFVGSTGAGKTTITNLLNRFYDIDQGTITIDGVALTNIKRDFLRENIAMVLQDTHLFTGTVMENIRYGRLDATDEEVIAAAKVANAHGFIRRLEQGYDTLLEGDGQNLSQGQRQLLNIARAAISKAPILVLDEATSSVDTRTEKYIEEALDRLMASRTTFVIAHRLSTVRNSDEIIVLEQGCILEQGNHQSLLAEEGKYHSLYTGASKLE